MSYEKSVHEVLERLYNTRDKFLEDMREVEAKVRPENNEDLVLAAYSGALSIINDIIYFITVGDEEGSINHKGWRG